MEIRQLQYFTAIVREGSFSRAARRLHVGQPALSKQIRALERELGVDLLVRLPAGVRPTLAGARLAEMSQKFLDYADEMASAVRATTASVTGTITLGLSPSLVPVLAEHLQRRLAEELPQVRITIVEALSMFQEEWLAEDRLDLGAEDRVLGEDLVAFGEGDVRTGVAGGGRRRRGREHEGQYRCDRGPRDSPYRATRNAHRAALPMGQHRSPVSRTGCTHPMSTMTA